MNDRANQTIRANALAVAAQHSAKKKRTNMTPKNPSIGPRHAGPRAAGSFSMAEEPTAAGPAAQSRSGDCLLHFVWRLDPAAEFAPWRVVRPLSQCSFSGFECQRTGRKNSRRLSRSKNPLWKLLFEEMNRP